MFAFYNQCKNIYGKDIVLNYKKNLPNSDGCQFTLKNCQAPKGLTFIIFTAVGVFLFLPYLLEVDKTIYLATLFLISVAAFLQFNRVDEEKFLVVPSVGLQYTTEYQYGRQSNLFIHWQDIKDIIINEVIHMNTKPRLKCLEEIYSEVQKVLTQ